MTNKLVQSIAGVIDLVLESSSRANEMKPTKYWWPLSVATYGTAEILEALDSLCSFRTTMWEKTVEFERRFALVQQRRHAAMVNSGSSADLLLALLMANPARPLLEPGDEVLVSAVTWPTQVWSLQMAGFQVRLVDVDPATLNICPEALRQSIGPRTRAVFLVHVLGNPCMMDAIMPICQEHGLTVVEDCCEALGSTWDGVPVGNFGIGAAFSFFFSHHMTTMEGGMVVTDDDEHADHLRILRAHGWTRNLPAAAQASFAPGIDPRYTFVNWGLNVRPTEIQAGFGLRQLDRLPGFAARRTALAARFYEAVSQMPWLSGPIVDDRATVQWMALPIIIQAGAPFTQADLAAHLESVGVETRPIIAGNLARQPAARLFPDLAPSPLPGADVVHDRGIYVGLSPMFHDSGLDRLISVLAGFAERDSRCESSTPSTNAV